ncbi:uncharacterized protein VTP21DRAFT_10461 [Calcarisporiella thermophila]|uniref:uncharacterized protein n=1 Tax=Calcarisporiella thermophila TaxID=911321 RepID=UPI0037426C5C
MTDVQSIHAIRDVFAALLRRAAEQVQDFELTLLNRIILTNFAVLSLLVLYLYVNLRNQRNPYVIWERLNLPVIVRLRPWIFSIVTGVGNPHSRSISFRVTTIMKGSCSGILQDERRIRDIFGNVHIGALITFAQLLSEMAAISKLGNKGRANLVSLSVEYLKKSRGLITGTAHFQLEDGPEKQEIVSEVVLKDMVLDTVAIVKLTWEVEAK